MLYKASLTLLAAFYTLGKLKETFYDEYYTVDLYDEYDFIVVGAGPTGSAVASRLSENEEYKVLLIEAGGSGRGDPNIQVPAFAHELFVGDKDWKYFTVNQPNCNDRQIFYPRGKVAGGCTAHNECMHQRGHREDFDSWEEAGAEGWGYDAVQKFFQKIERSMDENIPQYIGKNGAIKLMTKCIRQMYDIMEKATREMGYGLVDDESGEGITVPIHSIYDGKRQYSANVYLWPTYENRKSTFHLSFNSVVEKILLSETLSGSYKADGVRFQRGGKIHEVRATKEVIVSAGAINSPQILMLSGIGPRQHLHNVNIDTIVDLPGVGSNYQDHNGVVLYFYSSKFPANISVSEENAKQSFHDYLLQKESPLSLNAGAGSATIKFHSNTARLAHTPYMEMYVFGEHKKIPKFWPESSLDAARLIAKAQNGSFSHFTIALSTLQPLSHGTIRLQSNEPTSKPLIDPNMLSDPKDEQALLEALRKVEAYESTPVFQKLGVKNIQYPECNEFNYTIPRSDEYYRCMIRKIAIGFFHGSGSLKIGRQDDDLAVVDSRLRVYGVENLRVADASVMPYVVSAPIQATCYMIGEKAAHMIKEDWDNV